MAAKGKAAKSASGASMSKYDVEVESRLQALEKVAHPVPTGATQQKVDDRDPKSYFSESDFEWRKKRSNRKVRRLDFEER